MIKFACSNCSKTIRVDDKYAGKKGKCPKCGQAVVVPECSTIIEFHCDGCGAKIKVPDRHAGKKGKCPKCQGPIVVPELAPAPLAPEPAPEPRPAAGLDRRLVIAIAGGAVVVLVVIIGAIIFLRSGGSEPVVTPRRPRRTAQTDSRPEPAPAEERGVEAPPVESPTAPSSLVAADAVTLKFAPIPGEAQSRRVTTVVDIAQREGEQEFQVIHTQSFVVDLEAQEAQADGTIPIRVTLAQIRVRTEIVGGGEREYDSTDPESAAHPMAAEFVPFLGKRFTIRVSSRGEVIDAGLDELFLAAAVDVMEAEDDMMRKQLKERAAEAIKRTDETHGSRQERTRVLQKQLQERSLFTGAHVHNLVGDLVALLPAEPVASGATWNGPFAIELKAYEGIPGAYTLTDIGQDTCTIDTQAQRSAEDEPFVYQSGRLTVSNKYAGTVRGQIVLDRKTGWLLRKEQKTSMSGKVMRVPNEPGVQPSTRDATIETTTTVAPVE